MTEPGLAHLPFPVLIGDIGGTNARFAVVADAEASHRWIGAVHTADFATVDDAIDAEVVAGAGLRPKSAVLALAGPIKGERVPLTNHDWVVAPRDSIRRFGFQDMVLLNDFEALSLALPDLGGADLDPIGGGTVAPTGTRVVLGPGTGLGAAALVHAAGTWIPVPGEGGHIDLGPVSARDMAIWPHLERTGGRISAETLLCGTGLLRLYRGIAAADGAAAPLSGPVDVTAAGLAGSDAVAAEAIALFCLYLGRFAGDLALIFMARGGVYLAGGISAKIATALRSGGFREAFLAKAPHRDLLEEIATAIIAKDDAALAGIAAFARSPRRFALDLAGRHWRR